MFEVQQGKSDEFMIDEEGVLRLGTQLCVLDVDDVRKELLKEAHYSSIKNSSDLPCCTSNIILYN